MASDLISRKALIENFEGKEFKLVGQKAVVELLEDAIDAISKELFKTINAQPTVDAVEVVHGHWLNGNCGHYYICSDCSQIADFDFNYCPNCGADMRGNCNE